MLPVESIEIEGKHSACLSNASVGEKGKSSECKQDESRLQNPDENDNDAANMKEDHDPEISILEKLKKRKKGIVYVANIPKHMNVTRIREMLGQYGNIGRIFLQPEKLPTSSSGDKKKRRKKLSRHFTEGWVEFESKRIAKQLAAMLNNKQIATRKKSKFYDSLWSIKYLPRFKWVHLSERLNYEQAVHKQRLMAEVSQARKEANFFQNNLDKSELIKKKNKKQKT